MKRKILCALTVLALCLAALPALAEEAAEKGTREAPYRLGEACAFTAEILADGSPRQSAGEEDYVAAAMTLTLDNFLTPAYFQDAYARLYRLNGDEAGAQITVQNESEAAVVPQNAFWLTVETADGRQSAGYQLMDAEISGNYGATLESGERATLYKRFDAPAGAEPVYLVLTYCAGGERISRYFLLEERVVYPALESGSRGEDVIALQTRLIELGYLNDDADGIFGPNTEAAVRAARQAADMEDSGAADDDFQHLLYREDFPGAA